MIQVWIEFEGYVGVAGQAFFPKIEIGVGYLVVAGALQNQNANLEFRGLRYGIVSAQVEKVARGDFGAEETYLVRFFQVWILNFLDHLFDRGNLLLGLLRGNSREACQIVNLIDDHLLERPGRACQEDDSGYL